MDINHTELDLSPESIPLRRSVWLIFFSAAAVLLRILGKIRCWAVKAAVRKVSVCCLTARIFLLLTELFRRIHLSSCGCAVSKCFRHCCWGIPNFHGGCFP